MKVTIILVILFNNYFVDAISLCNNFETCGACVGYGEERCAWCSEPNITLHRCQPREFHSTDSKWCKKILICDPEMEEVKLKKDIPLRPGNSKEKPIQFTPQELDVNLRPGALFNFQMTYQPAVDFPLDIYFLLDYSHTMSRHVTELRTQAQNIYNELIKFTNNVRFGVGSFVDKPDFPYVDTSVHTSYSFKNHLSLTNNMSIFENVIKGGPSGSNFDDPEGGLDGLMQVMVCEKELGWRVGAHRIIILCTDSTYHSAGDGKMVGAMKPNDMQCHLSSDNLYEYSLIQDYPSVSQLNNVATEGNFRIIFAATANVKTEYEYLTKEIFGARYAELRPDSNIVEIIKKAYLESIRNVIIKYNWPTFVKLQLSPDCSKEDICRVLHKKPVLINATLSVSCPENPLESVQSLTVGPGAGGLEDKLKINLGILCQCSCESGRTDEPNSPFCSGSGSLQCGICKCNEGRSGNICQCDGSTSKTDLHKCRQHKNQTNFCNGRGTCVCGQCSCNPGFSGDFCEFDDSICKSLGNKLCDGHGRCRLGRCHCDPEWTSDDCSCSLDMYNCYAPYSKTICSGNGDCICGECVCRKDGVDTGSLGAFCEEEQCKELEGYVECNHLNNKTYCDQLVEYNLTLSTGVQFLNKSEINNSTWPTAKWCHKALKNGTLVFMYIYNKSNKKLDLIIQKELDEFVSANLWVAVGSAIGSVLLIGLLTVILWKICVDVMDEKEYNKFMQEAKHAGFDVAENPIYQPAAVNFSNPTYIAGRC